MQWSRKDLAQKAKVAEKTVVDFEREARKTYERTLRDIQAVFEDAGVKFLNGRNGAGVWQIILTQELST